MRKYYQRFPRRISRLFVDLGFRSIDRRGRGTDEEGGSSSGKLADGIFHRKLISYHRFAAAQGYGAEFRRWE